VRKVRGRCPELGFGSFLHFYNIGGRLLISDVFVRRSSRFNIPVGSPRRAC
jgi:hypothetical protein